MNAIIISLLCVTASFATSISSFATPTEFTPANRTWYFEGSDIPGAKLVFNKDHSVSCLTLKSKPAYGRHCPTRWDYSAAEQRLTLKLMNVDSKDLRTLKDSYASVGARSQNPESIDVEAKTIRYHFPARIDFFGANFEEKK